MLDKEQILEAMLRECRILKALYHELPEDRMDYRPSAGQRSTLELLRYLSMMPVAIVRGLIEQEGWDHYWRDLKAADAMPAGAFPGRLDAQMQGLRELFAGMSDDDFAGRPTPLPWDDEVYPLGEALLDMPLKYLVGYRMQLFLYAKQSGAVDLDSGHCWRGRPMRLD